MEIFEADATLSSVRITFRGAMVGVSSRALACKPDEHLGAAEPDAGFGSGERATQLGESTQYRVLHFTCRRCTASAARSFYDERYLPVCPHGGAAHGVMELSHGSR